MCLSDSKPAPFSFFWTFPVGSYSGKILSLTNVDASSSGLYSCKVSNKMIPSFGMTVIGENTNQILFDVPCKYGNKLCTEFGKRLFNCTLYIY